MSRRASGSSRRPEGHEAASPGTYVFCVVEAAELPSVGRSLATLPGAGKPRVLPVARSIWMVVADAPPKAFSEQAVQRCLEDVDCVARAALGHEAVIDWVFRRWPVIPLKLFTIFSSDARVLAHLAGRTAEIRGLFKRLRGHQEWSARVFPGDPPRLVPRVAAASGRDYLEATRGRHEGARERAARIAEEAVATFDDLSALAAEVRPREPGVADRAPGPAVIEAAFLVPSRKVAAWKSRARVLSAALARRGCRLEVSGPWPPYTFIAPRD